MKLKTEQPWWAEGAIALTGALIGGLFVLLGTLIASNAESARQERVLAEELEREARDLRRPAYTAFADNASAFGTAVTNAVHCIYEARDVEPPPDCGIATDVQFARYELQGSVNEMYVVGTPEALEAMRAVMATLPPTMVGFIGPPALDVIDEEAFTDAYRAFADIATCDTNPTPPDDC